MDSTLILWIIGLAAAGTVYTYVLTFTTVGRRLNASPKALPFLTVLGCAFPLIALGFMIDWGTAFTASILFAAVGAAFVVRGIWRLASDIVFETEQLQEMLAAIDDHDTDV